MLNSGEATLRSPRVLFAALPLLLANVTACTGVISGSSPNPNGDHADTSSQTRGAATAEEAAAAAAAVGTGAGSQAQPATRRLRKLTPEQVEHSLQSLGLDGTGVAARLAPTLSGAGAYFSTYAGRQDMSVPHQSELNTIMTELAGRAVEGTGPAAQCAQSTAASACVRDFAKSFGRQAFRRPLTDEEQLRFFGYYEQEQAKDGVKIALTSLMRAFLLSPHFLFMPELGSEANALETSATMTPHEVAAGIGFLLTDAPPDAALSAAADANQLVTSAQRAMHVRRLIESPTTASGLLRFLAELFRYPGAASSTSRDAALFPGYGAPQAESYVAETNAFVQEILYREDATVKTLLTAPFVMATSRTAVAYGVSEPVGDAPTKVMPPPGQRAGMLTQPSWLAAYGRTADANVVGRGKFILTRLLCQSVPPPPPNVNAMIPPPDGAATLRQRLQQHSSNEACKACHQFMDPLGLAFGNFDAIGGFRTSELNQTVDASGSFTDATGANYMFNNGVELSHSLADAPAVKDCLARQAYSYLQGQTAEEVQQASAEFASRFRANGGQIRELLIDILSADTSFVRRSE